MHSIPYVYLWQTFVFALYFRKIRPEQKCLGLYVITLLPINRFSIFWTQIYVVFSCGGAGTGQIQRFCTHKQLNAFCHNVEHSPAESTDIPNSAFHLRRLTHILLLT